MAKDNDRKVSGEQVAPEQRNADGEPAAARDGESVPISEVTPIEANVNPMSAGEEAERQALEAYPRASVVQTFDGHDKPEKVRAGHASTSRANVGRVIVLHEDREYEGEVYKAGVHDLPVKVADHFMGENLAFEPAGKKKGR